MILLIDIGNTNIVIGACEKQEILFHERISTNHTATSLEYIAMFRAAFDLHQIDAARITGGIVSSVVPSVTATVRTAAERYIHHKMLTVEPGMKTGLQIVIDNPAQLGSDLVVDAVAGIQSYPLPLIVIDMGTATTMSVINREKQYIGGVIIPGVVVSHDSLIGRTSQLPKVALEPPKRLVGGNTIDCVKSGLIYGNASMMDGMIDRIQEELGEKCHVVATGGLAKVIIPLCKHEIALDEDLLLKGLMLLYEKNQ